ncbi:TPA: pentapeptide repeat-containing protein [Campylobacter coli]|nr:pentapeptide repeat-containing protein [Campylobacter coli]
MLGCRCKDKIEVNIDDFEGVSDKKEYIKKHKNLFIISNKEKKFLDLKIDFKKMSSLTDMDYQIKFEGCRINFTNSFFEEKIKIGQNLYFNHCDFKAIELKNICFKNFEINGYRDKSDQKKPIVFKACEFKELSLNNSIFSEDIKFKEETKIKYLDINLSEFKKYFFMQNCTIKNISLWKNKFKNRCYFVDSNFGYKDKMNKAELNFSNAHFENNAYFNNSEFYNYADFHECEFEKIACFYGVKFYKAPNFSACYFKESKATNLINVDIDKLDFKSVEKYIEDNYEDESYENKIKGMQNEKEIFKIQNKHKLRYAKNLKDSFRVIKDILITQNNTLEAQEWHKLELYAKEKELEIQLDNLKKEHQNQRYNPEDYKKLNRSKIKTLVLDLILLIFSSLLLILYVLFLPFFLLYAILRIPNVVKKLFYYFYISFRPLEWNKFIIFWKVKFNHYIKNLMTFGRKMLDYTLWFDCVLLQVYRNTSNHHTNFLKILNFTILMISLYAFMGFVFSKTINFISSFNPVSIIIANYFILFALIVVFFNVKRQLHQQGSILFFGIFGTFIILMMSFLSPVYIPTFCFLIYFASILFFYLLFLCEIKLFVFILRLSAYICLIVVIISKPQFINPFAGVFSSDELYESQFEKSLNDLNASAIINLAKISFKEFNLNQEYKNISFAELNSAKASIVANKENLLKLNDVNSNIAKEVLGEKYTELLKTINQDKITENTIKSTSILYGIILLLCIFSLQKTARKNSIVPS